MEEVETPQLLDAWIKTLDLIEALNPVQIIPGHLEQGWKLDAKADLEHNRKYLDLFGEKVTHAKKKPQVDELFETFKQAFPEVCDSQPTLQGRTTRAANIDAQADKNLDFFLGHLSNTHGEGGEVWEGVTFVRRAKWISGY